MFVKSVELLLATWYHVDTVGYTRCEQTSRVKTITSQQNQVLKHKTIGQPCMVIYSKSYVYRSIH